MSTYPGNPSLPAAVRDRVIATFQQTIAVYKQGRIDEAVAGCGLILQMDPQFDPARRLLDSAGDPTSTIDVDSLLPSSAVDDSLAAARQAMKSRDYQRVVNITTEILTDDLMNDDARILNEEARERIEAAPFVEQFARKCEAHIVAGNPAAARNDLDKARTLDPGHPAIARMEALLASGAAQQPASAPLQINPFPTDDAPFGVPAFTNPASAAPSAAFDLGAARSFIVDNAPAAPSRGTAPAADFGFTFEEEKAAGNDMIGGSQPAAAAPSVPDFSNAFGGGSSSGDPLSSFSFDSPAAPAAPRPAPPAPAPPRAAAPAQSSGFSFDSPAPSTAPAERPFGFAFDTPGAAAPAAPPAAAEQAFGGFSFAAEPAAAAASTPASFSFDAPAPAPQPFGFSFDAPSTPAATPPQPAAPPPSDFGFSFDPPSTAATPPTGFNPAGREFDLSSTQSQTSPDEQRKIQQYLSDGDRAYEAGDYQQAIDLWSRIFLIDVTNEQASDRIEKAKLRRRDLDAKAEAILGAAAGAFDRSDWVTARAKFNEVLRIDPANSTAADYLDRIDAEEAAAASRPAAAPAPVARSPFADDDNDIVDSDVASLMPPDPNELEATPAQKQTRSKAEQTKSASTAKKKPMSIVAALAIALIVAIGGWFGWSQLHSDPAPDPVATTSVLQQASSLGNKGQFDRAIALLQDIKADDPQHDKALEMIADLQHRKALASEHAGGRPVIGNFDEQLAKAQAAFEAHDYEAAKIAFDAAASMRDLSPEMKQAADVATQQVGKVASAKQMFRERKFQDAIGNLQPLLQADPQNQNVKRLLVDAHFNLGALALQEERLPDANREFEAALQNDPTDEQAKKSREIATRYNTQPKDLLYKIYVKYLPLRQLS
jgi:hypothetical protein